jgi:hypothetical protein
MVAKQTRLGLLDKVFVGILLVIFGGIVLHAPLGVGLETLFPNFSLLIKSWKELLMIAAALIAAVLLWRKKEWGLLKSPIILLVIVYVLLHLLLVPFFPGDTASTLAGLAIDLRYLAFFVLVYLAMRLYPPLRRTFIITFVVGALIVVIFAILQVTVLPVDFLKYLGYGDTTIQPYLTVDQNTAFIRISSTLRGPNPLGAYAVIVLSLLLAFMIKGWSRVKEKRPAILAAVLGVGGLVALWASYSRSALIAAAVAIALVVVLAFGRRVSRRVWIFSVVAAFALAGGLIAASGTNFVSNVLLHNSFTSGAAIDSNQGHLNSLEQGTVRMVQQPLGAGIGSTGSASLLGDSPLIVENQYLFVAHEAGWLGLALFLLISWKVLKGLWEKRSDWLALGVFASGIGLVVVGLLLPVWVDDTVSIIWWGLAAIVIGGVYDRKINKAPKRAA